LDTLNHFIQLGLFLLLLLGQHFSVFTLISDLVFDELRALFVIDDPVHLTDGCSYQDRVNINSYYDCRVIKSCYLSCHGSNVAADIKDSLLLEQTLIVEFGLLQKCSVTLFKFLEAFFAQQFLKGAQNCS